MMTEFPLLDEQCRYMTNLDTKAARNKKEGRVASSAPFRFHEKLLITYTSLQAKKNRRCLTRQRHSIKS